MVTAELLKETIIEYGNDIYSFCCYLTTDRYLAEDLYQDIFLKAMEKKKEFAYREDTSCEQKLKEARNYLIGMAIRIWKNQKRKQIRRQGCSLENLLEQGIQIAGEDNLEEWIISEEERILVNQQISKLSEKLKVVVMMHYMTDMSIAEIAKELHLPEGTVKSRMHKARTIIMKGLKVNGYEE